MLTEFATCKEAVLNAISSSTETLNLGSTWVKAAAHGTAVCVPSSFLPFSTVSKHLEAH